MKSLKKVEIVTGAIDSKKILDLLEKNGISDYTMLKNVTGRGSRGFQDGDGLHDAFQNRFILLACTEEELNKIVEPLRDILKKSGGMCLVSDALWLIH